MSQSAIWDALLIVGDAIEDRRLDDAERVLAEIAAAGAWDFEHWPSSLAFTQRTLRAGDTLSVTYTIELA